MDLMESINPNIKLIDRLGFWPFGKPKFHKYYRRIVMFLLLVFHHIPEFLYLVVNISNMDAVLSTFYITVSSFSIYVKLIIFNSNVKLIKESADFLKRKEFQPVNKEEETILKDSINLSRRMFYSFLTMAMISVNLYNIYPILDRKEKDFPCAVWFPFFDVTIDRNYYIEYMWQNVCNTYGALATVFLDTFFALIMVQSGAQYDVLASRIKNLGSDKSQSPEELGANLKKCIHHHRLILEWVEKTTRAFEFLIFFQLITCFFALTLTMYILSIIPPSGVRCTKLVVYQMAILTQVFLICYFGNRMTIKSENLPNSAYFSNWLEKSGSYNQDLRFFMMRSQRPNILRVMYMIPIDLGTFSGILRLCWTYCTALRTVQDK